MTGASPSQTHTDLCTAWPTPKAVERAVCVRVSLSQSRGWQSVRRSTHIEVSTEGRYQSVCAAGSQRRRQAVTDAVLSRMLDALRAGRWRYNPSPFCCASRCLANAFTAPQRHTQSTPLRVRAGTRGCISHAAAAPRRQKLRATCAPRPCSAVAPRETKCLPAAQRGICRQPLPPPPPPPSPCRAYRS